uniref:Uncharacterized protein n=1 Tax=Heterorhabditis bacteriophora TaxID=37862 RepID=A0A1I7W6I7_HETBA
MTHDPNPSVEYSVIQKKPSIIPKDIEELSRGTDSWSSKNGGDSEKESIVQNTQFTMPPPPVPPKPRSASVLAEPTNEIPERRGVLPAQVRPLIHRPPSPREGRATPSIEPDLVGKDRSVLFSTQFISLFFCQIVYGRFLNCRYDKASKCFSYAPTKALNEAFDKPRRPSFSRTVERKEEEIQNISPEEVNNAPIQATDIVRVTETPKWDDEIEKAKQLLDACE